jgi:hypothetical protein
MAVMLDKCLARICFQTSELIANLKFMNYTFKSKKRMSGYFLEHKEVNNILE